MNDGWFPFMDPKGLSRLAMACRHFVCESCGRKPESTPQNPSASINISIQQGSLGTRGVWDCPNCKHKNITDEKQTEYLFRVMGVKMP